MKTLVELENTNCTWCHDAMLGALRERPGVARVWSDFSSGCLVIEHEDDPDALVSLVKSTGRAVAVAWNGERMMVSLEGHEAAECPVSDEALSRRVVREGPTTVSPTGPPGGDRAFAARRPYPTWSKPTTIPAADRSVPTSGRPRDGGPGIRVLARERFSPGLLLRAARALRRIFRVVLRQARGQ